jgi:hypothetical protein
MPEELRDRYQYRTQADLRRLRQSGYDKSLTSLQDAVADYVLNYLVAAMRLWLLKLVGERRRHPMQLQASEQVHSWMVQHNSSPLWSIVDHLSYW